MSSCCSIDSRAPHQSAAEISSLAVSARAGANYRCALLKLKKGIKEKKNKRGADDRIRHTQTETDRQRQTKAPANQKRQLQQQQIKSLRRGLRKTKKTKKKKTKEPRQTESKAHSVIGI